MKLTIATVNMTEFYTLSEAEVLVADFQMDYNWHRPHSTLGDLAPAVFAERWRTDHQPAGLSSGWTRNRGQFEATQVTAVPVPDAM